MPQSTRSTIQNCRWHSYRNPVVLAQAAVQEILRAARAAINARGVFRIVLAGGSTPRKVYEALRTEDTDWRCWQIYFGDERCLPPDHDERNSYMAALAWLDHVDIPDKQIHAIPAELGAADAAESYAHVVDSIALFDLVLLGLGEDGHTASLFPHHDLGNVSDAPSTLAVFDAPKPPPQRVSLSARRLSAAREVMFLVTGSSKAQAVADWRAGSPIPASFIVPEGGVDIYIEEASA
ncbi:MAG: 6-phosphogluconolactonase [Sideroxydans sp.]|nr:6-phosphogluconolactonase [Sideroxydans sp.]